MNPSYNHRREQIKINSTLEKLEAFEPVPLEEFPFRQYFQFNIIFKCIISFFAFGIYIKGFNFALFLSVLIGYYWYCINNVIDEFYKRKIQAIGISEEDYKEIKNGGFHITELKNKKSIFIIDNENEENEQKKEDVKEEGQTNVNNNNINTNINREANNIKNDIEEDLKEENKDNIENKNNTENKFNFGNNNYTNNLIFSKEQIKDLDDKNKNKNKDKDKEDNKNINEKAPLLNNLNDILTGNNNLRAQNNNINNRNNINYINNINNINNNNINKKIEKKDEKEKKEQVENRPESALNIIFEIIYVFCISFIPSLCDEYELNNPIPPNNYNNNNNDNQENNDENNIGNNNDNNINNNNENNNVNNNNINNDFNNNENSGSLNQEEDSNNNKMTSSRVVNMSDDSSRDNRMYKLIKKDNQSTNENEYVFSENSGIDNLSMNSELFKQKREKEKEKEKDKEKEKQIFEEDEEYLIEEDKKKKED